MTDRRMGDRRSTDPAMTAVIEAVSEMSNHMNTLIEVTAKDVRERRKNRVWIAIAAVTAAILGVLVFINIFEARQARERIVDCTTPDGECSQEGAERAGVIVSSLVTEIVCANAAFDRALVESAVPGGVDPATLPPLPTVCEGVVGAG